MKLITSIILLTVLIPYSLFTHHESVASSKNTQGSATYSVTFEATWSNETHPHTNFPGGAHFSPLIGATHNANATFWQTGTLASDGIERMAETGATGTLRSEVETQIINNNALAVLSGGSSSSPGSAAPYTFEINQTFPLVTLVTMIAPSPDWFVGVSNLSLLDENGQWIANHVVTLYPYDSGTDSGRDYTSPNNDTQLAEVIKRIRGEFPFSDNPIGTFTFTRLDAPEAEYKLFLPLMED